ncbi:MAG TPA: M48 family metalloprotease [Terracidiphilus sp.]|nr:M48 family metalloprotease [Terracidiphilus sp.]
MADSSQTLTKEAFRAFKHPLYNRRFALALFFSLLLFPLIAAGLVAGTIVLVVPLFAFLIWMSGRVIYAEFLGRAILVSELNYARIHHIGEDLKARIGYKKKFDIFVYEQGNFNAFLYKFLFYRRAVFLNSELLEVGVTDDELRWLIGRFVGYLRARREAGFWGWAIRAAQKLIVFNFFLLPYERALVYTGDRIALGVIGGDISSGVSAMQKIFVGRQLGYSVNPSGIVAQHRLVKGSLFALLARLPIAYPHMTARYVDLIGFAKKSYPEQFQRFDAANPGLPDDLERLTALPNAAPGSGGDPIFVPLVAAIAVLALGTLFTMKVVMPRLNRPTPSEFSEPSVTPSQSETTPSTSGTQGTESTNTGTITQPYTSADGRYSVQFPSTPTESSSQISLGTSGTTTLYQALVDQGSISYLVAYCDYPSGYLDSDPQTALAGFRDNIVKAEKGTVTSDDAIDLNGVPGRAFVFTGQDGSTYSVHDFLSGQRLYQVVVTAGSGSTAAGANDFLNSFRVQ